MTIKQKTERFYLGDIVHIGDCGPMMEHFTQNCDGIILDDFICSGDTLRHTITELDDYASRSECPEADRPRCVGIMLYGGWGFGDTFTPWDGIKLSVYNLIKR